MTHDLLANVLKSLGARLDRVAVTRLHQGTFYAELTVRRANALLRIDARPSDALALALRTGAPVYVARPVLDEAGLKPQKPPKRARIDPNDAI